MSTIAHNTKYTDIKETFLTYPFYIVTSPFKGFGDLKYEGRGSRFFAIVIMIVYCLYSLANEIYKGFVITEYHVVDRNVNTIYIVVMALLPVLLFVVSNWSITAITDGIGKMDEIFMVYTYALYPKIILSVLGLIVSNLVTKDEAAFCTFFYSFGNIAFGFYLFIGLITIHEYSFTKAIGMIILTFLAMAIIIFVAALFISLSSEVILFFVTVFTEISLKL